MGYQDYEKALKLGEKGYRQAVARGDYPYLQVLDEILSYTKIVGETSLGLVEVPLELIVGTKTKSRQWSFAHNFMPLMPASSEFCYKWGLLCDSLQKEGLRDPIIAYEFMNRFYVLEGNKRVSVLKYLDGVSIPARVVRLIPQRGESLENKIYYEFMDFYEDTEINYLWFSREGSFVRLLEAVGKQPGELWSAEEKKEFHSVYVRFRRAYEAKDGGELAITAGDALLVYLELFGYEEAKAQTEAEMRNDLSKIWKELLALERRTAVALSMNPNPDTSRGILTRILSEAPKVWKITFLHVKSPASSGWTYGHDLGRRHLEQVFPGQIDVVSVNDVKEGENAGQELIRAAERGSDIVFTTSPTLLMSSLKAAVEYPKMKVLNCSVFTPHPYLRTYYARMYEAKFLTGLIAGCLARGTSEIGYIADYPIYGMLANINAFALGARTVNPQVKIYLEWSKRKGAGAEELAKRPDISFISDRDILPSGGASRRFGLYQSAGGEPKNMAMPVWHWGKLYETILRNIMSGVWKNEESHREPKALNYGWGMSAGVIDLICSQNLPRETKQLVQIFRNLICSGKFHPFTGPLYAQGGEKKKADDERMTPEEIITMDWLEEHVVGTIPTLDELQDEAKEVVRIQGVGPGKKGPAQ